MRIDNKPVLVDVQGPSPASSTVLNNGPSVVYYGATSALALAHGSSLASQASLTITAPTWFVVADPPVNGGMPFVANLDVRAVVSSLAGGSGSPADGTVTLASLATDSRAHLKSVVVDTGAGYGARPTGFASVEFVGATDPDVLAHDGDTWVPTS